MNIHTLFNVQSSRLAHVNMGDYRAILQQQSWALTIGNFDGVHQGHQVVLDFLSKQAIELNGLKAVMIFEPQPLEYLMKGQSPIRIMSVRQKVELLFHFDVDAVLICRFNQTVLQLSADQFLCQLRAHLNVKGFVLGQDFRFGYQRQGDMAYLVAYGQKCDIQVMTIPDLMASGVRVSSSLIRSTIQESRFDDVKVLLGRPFLLSGKIKHGLKMARDFGYPTANVHLVPLNPPIFGVFVGKVYVPYNGFNQTLQRFYKAVANAGSKPTVRGVCWQLEVHIFDEAFASDAVDIVSGIIAGHNEPFQSDDTVSLTCYGQRLAFEPLAQLRDERKFDSVDDLKMAIVDDICQAKAYFK